MDYTEILKEIYEEIQPYAQMGKPASYIPELLKVNPDRYGICLRTIEGKEYAQGDSDERFAIQSISKGHHIPYLYSWTTEPWKTQYWIREIMNRMYRNNIDGLCGNDDCGQMSAWYIFSAMGFYPVCPGTDQYVIGAPYLPYMQVNLENGKTFTVRADKVSDKNRYIKSVTLNGKPYKKAYITHQDIMNGGELVFQMTSSPNKRRQFTTEEKPYSLVE